MSPMAARMVRAVDQADAGQLEQQGQALVLGGQAGQAGFEAGDLLAGQRPGCPGRTR